MSAIASHLWISTIVLAAALIAARFLPLTARTRHAVLFCGLLKFAIPAALFTAPLRAMGIDLTNLGRESTALLSIEWLAGPTPVRTFSPPPSNGWPDVLILSWIISAAALAVAWAVARRRLVDSALNAASVAAPRERSALTAARHRLGLRASVDVIRSTICEAPAVVRIIRPVVILPDGGCDALDDAELESLLRHECAHVARRDNLLGLIESAIIAAFWFHPLVWVAQRAIATAREEACDEVAASTTDAIDTYISALSKICRAVLAPRLAGVSCMASAHLKERLNHLMSYENLRSRALSHRVVVTLAMIVVVSCAVGSGVRTASAQPENPYALTFSVRPGDGTDTLELSGRVSQPSTGLVLTRPHIVFARGSSAKFHAAAAGREIWIDIRDLGSEVSATMRVAENGAQVQQSTHSAVPKPPRTAAASERVYTGAPISLNLKDAQLKDVLDTFGKLAGLDIRYPADLAGTVTLEVKDMPWDEAFDLILRRNGLTWELEGSVMVIR